MTEQQIFELARTAAIAAFNNTVPKPMVVIGGGYREVVEDGMCGFAKVTIKPARGKFVTFLKKNSIGRTAYTGGYYVNMGSDIDRQVGLSQSYERKYAAAKAFAKVLTDNNITCYADANYD